MSAGYDAEVAELFRDLRAATALTESDLAMRLGTRPDVVQSLEQGAIYALPAWPETYRVVNAYGALLNLDVRPLLQRIYSQIEAGIVELQPKQMPDMPMMTPPESRDFGYGGGNAAGGNHAGGAHAPNPLDIPWPPAPNPQAPPQQQPRQNTQAAPAQQAARPNPQMPQQPKAWPQAQPQQQPWPPQQPMPQGARPAQHPQYPGAAPQARPEGRAAQPHPQQAAAPQMRPQQQPQPQIQPQHPPQAQPQPEPHPLDADFSADPVEPAEPKKTRKAGLLKWGLVALIISVVAFGVWFALSQAPGPSDNGAGQSQDGPLDPDDPRSRKADRLPSAF